MLFLFGTLRDAALLRIVTGQPDIMAQTRPADWPDHDTRRVADGDWPVCVPSPGASAPGLVLAAADSATLARLDHYEGLFGYVRSPARVRVDGQMVAASVYLCPSAAAAPDGPWSLRDWAGTAGAMTRRAAREVMERYARGLGHDTARLYPFIRARAWAQGLAGTGAPARLRRDPGPDAIALRGPGGGDFGGHDGFFRLRRFDIRHRRFDGSQSDWFGRECFIAYDAALVLPYDPATDRVALVEQLRYGPVWRGDPNPWTLEPVAGLVDAGEDPADTARREAMEEAGLHLQTLRPMMGVYPSPGYSSEFFHCFLGLCALPAQAGTGGGGLAAENEDIRTHLISFDHAMSLVDSGEITAGPLVAMLLWLARHRPDLRAG